MLAQVCVLKLYSRAADMAAVDQFAPPTSTAPFTDSELKVCLRVLRVIASADAEALVALPPGAFEARQQLVGLSKHAKRRDRPKPPPAAAAEPASDASAPTASLVADGAVSVPAQFLSRPLYMNPVCLLASRRPRGGSVNLMTISWLTAVDNDGGFACSVNQNRHTATLLAANPTFTLSVPVAGMEALVRRVGSTSGRRLPADATDKPAWLGIELCRPGWQPLSPAERAAAATEEEAAEGAPRWAADADVRLEPPSAAEADAELRHAVAVAPCVAHVVARVRTVRGIASMAAGGGGGGGSGGGGSDAHFLLVCQVVAAYARESHWSGKTLEPQREGAPPVLSFFGSQRFGGVQPLPPEDNKAAAAPT